MKNSKRFTIFDDDLVGLHSQKKVTVKKPIYLGECILADSKVIMAAFHYNVIIKNAGRENFLNSKNLIDLKL